jgi:hypothetical protein
MKKKWLFLCFFLTITSFGQKKLSLETAILNLSKKYGITFSYNTEQIKKFNKVVLQSSANLSDVFLELSRQTDLLFEKIDDTNYVILHKPEKTICGILLSQTREPIADVTVQYQNKYYTSNVDGVFKFKTKDINSTAYISSLGYEPIVISATTLSDSCTTIILKHQITYLDNVIIKDYLTSGVNKKENGRLQINFKKTGILPGVIEPDVMQSLQLIPGIQSPDETASGLHIRGGTPDQNLVLFDGIKTYQNAHFFGLISVFNPYVIEDIQLYRSGTNARYGGHAAGVLEMSTGEKIPNKTKLTAGSTLTHADISLQTPLFWDQTGLVVSARKSISELITTPTLKNYSSVAFQNSNLYTGVDIDNQELKNISDQLSFEDYSAKLSQKIGQTHTLNYNYIFNKNELLLAGNSTSLKSDVQDNIDTETNGQKIEWVYDNEQKGLKLKINYTYTSFDKQYNSKNKFDPENERIIDFVLKKESSIKETSYNALIEKKFTQKHKIQMGFQQSSSSVFFETENYGPNLNIFYDRRLSGDETSKALFTEYEAKFGSLLVNLGLRAQQFKTTETTHYEPRLYLNYQLTKHLGFKIAREIKHQSIRQTTDLRQDGLGYLFDKVWTVSTPGILPVLKSIQNNFGIYFQKKNWILDLEYYWKTTTGISYIIRKDLYTTSNEIGDDKNWGIDLLLTKKINKYKTWISYSYSKSRYTFENLNKGMPFDGAYDTPHHFIWSHNYALNSIEFALGWRYHTGVPYTARELNKNNVLTFDDINSQRLPNYKRLDFSVNYDFNWDAEKKVKSKLGFTLQNITNQKNILSQEYQYKISPTTKDATTDAKLEIQTLNRYSLGITPNIIFRIEF